jgi:uncharacterized membrane protein
LDSVKIEVKVENNGNEKVKEVNVELGLIDSDGKNIVRDLENLDNKKIDLSSISDGDDKTATFEFLVPPDFADESYKLVIKAYSDDLGEKALCTSSSSDLSDKYFQSIDGVREDAEENHIVLNDMVLSSATAQCGEKVQLSAEIYNIGDEDYEDQVKVTLFNKELNINMEQVVREDFDQGDSAPVDFEFNIPAAAKEKSYTLELKTYYDYKSNSDSYDIQSEKRFIQSITVLGNCQSDVSASDLRITAELDSQTPEATAGKEVIVDAQLKNIGVSQGTWVLSAIGNSEWSSLVSIEPQTLTLNAGETKAVSIKLALDKEASGEKEFTIRAISGSKVTEQRANLSIKAVSSSGFAEHMKANWFIYVIVLVNVILIIAIIAVIRRIVGSRDYQ